MKLKTIILGLSVFIASLTSMATAATPKYIFYFIGDGMGFGAVTLAQIYNQHVLGNQEPLNMLQMPVASFATTHSLSSWVTDSSAAGTALASGNKTNNWTLGVSPDTVPLISIATKLHTDGFGVGLVTTVAPDDATPGAFYAHQPSRNWYYEIALEAAGSGFEFIGGATLRGGRNNPARKKAILEALDKAGMDVVHGEEGLKQATRSRVMLLNTDTTNINDLGYMVDSIPGILTLPILTQACLDHLMKHTPDRFFMMVEGGSIDHAGHANDAAASIGETLAFDRSLGIALDFLKKHPDETLIVVTADHETGGLAAGNEHLQYRINPEVLKYTRRSLSRFSADCKAMINSRRIYKWEDCKEILRDNFGLFGPVEVSEADEAALRSQFEKSFSLRNSEDRRTLYESLDGFAYSVVRLVNKLAGVGWTTEYHTGAPVPLFAAGVGAERFNGVHDNTELPKLILGLARKK